jgi:hypothetical protein
MNLSGRGSTDAAISFINALSEGVKQRRIYQFDLAQKKIKRDQELADAKLIRDQKLFDLNKIIEQNIADADRATREKKATEVRQRTAELAREGVPLTELLGALANPVTPQAPSGSAIVNDAGELQTVAPQDPLLEVDYQANWNRGIELEEEIENSENNLELLRAEFNGLLNSPQGQAIEAEELKLQGLVEELAQIHKEPTSPSQDLINNEGVFQGADAVSQGPPKELTPEEKLRFLNLAQSEAVQAVQKREREQEKIEETRAKELHEGSLAEIEVKKKTAEFRVEQAKLTAKLSKMEVERNQLALDFEKALDPEVRLEYYKTSQQLEVDIKSTQLQEAQNRVKLQTAEIAALATYLPDNNETKKIFNMVETLRKKFGLDIHPAHQKTTLDMEVLENTLDLLHLHRKFGNTVSGKEYETVSEKGKDYIEYLMNDPNAEIPIRELAAHLLKASGLDGNQQRRVFDNFNRATESPYNEELLK